MWEVVHLQWIEKSNRIFRFHSKNTSTRMWMSEKKMLVHTKLSFWYYHCSDIDFVLVLYFSCTSTIFLGLESYLIGITFRLNTKETWKFVVCVCIYCYRPCCVTYIFMASKCRKKNLNEFSTIWHLNATIT